MIAYVIRRLFYALVTFFGITVATFVLIHAVPGDPLSYFMGSGSAARVPQPVLDAIRHENFLDRSLPEQYVHWVRGITTLDFGRSIIARTPVRDLIGRKLPNTLLLNFIAFVLAAAIGIPVGLWSGARSGRLFDRGSSIAFFLLYSLPSFWVALLLSEFFAVRLGILPLFGMAGDDAPLGLGAWVLDRSRYLVLPVVTLAYAQLAIFARFSRSAVREVISQDYVTTARAKGAGEATVVWRHALRNALLPIITLIGLTLPYLLSGSVIVEEIFQWDGIGLLYFDAIRQRDYPVVMALTVITALGTLLAMLVADLLYAVADPRVRLEGGTR